MNWSLYFDGACSPWNPGGKSTYGWVLIKNEIQCAYGYGYVNEGYGSTNNVAEYAALENGLDGVRVLWDSTPGFDPVKNDTLSIYGDSKLVILTVDGSWKAKKPHLIPYVQRIRAAIAGIQADFGIDTRLAWVCRERNNVADDYSNLAYELAMDKKLKPGEFRRFYSPPKK